MKIGDKIKRVREFATWERVCEEQGQNPKIAHEVQRLDGSTVRVFGKWFEQHNFEVERPPTVQIIPIDYFDLPIGGI